MRHLHPDLNTPPFAHEGHYAPSLKVQVRMAPMPFSPHRFILSVNIYKQRVLLLTVFADFRQFSPRLRHLVLHTGPKTYKHGNEIMCFLDVTFLFTNVPLDETIHICFDKSCFLFLTFRNYLRFCFTEFIKTCHEENPIIYLMVHTTTR